VPAAAEAAPDPGPKLAPTTTPVGYGMFGVEGWGDTSGFSRLVRREPVLPDAERPYGGGFDEIADELARAWPDAGDAIERVVIDRGEMTMYVRREDLVRLAMVLRDSPGLRFELCSSVSGVHYPDDLTGRPLHAVYHLTSLSFRRRIRLEVCVTDDDPHIPSLVVVWPTADWHERETWDLMGIVFDDHPGLTRIFMPDDWIGHPQRKDYPLGGIAVEYKGADIPPPNERRAYH
jgi:NADH-quinone oxidoreductase subunit C